MTQRITAQKLECSNVRKIVARREIEMIKKEDRPLVLTVAVLTVAVLTVVRSSVSRWKRGEAKCTLVIRYCRHILGLDNRFRTVSGTSSR